MELVSDSLKSALHLVVTVSESGVPDSLPSAEDVDSYSDDCEKGAYSDIMGRAGLIGNIRLFMGPRRKPSERLVLLGWAFDIGTRGSAMTPTPLGRSVHRAMLVEQQAASAQEVTEIRLGADREIAWETLVESLAKFDRYLLVDPYLERQQLQLLLRDTALVQAMTAFRSDKRGQKRKADLSDLVNRAAQFGDEPVPFEVRETDPDQLHDRFIIVGDEVWTLGASLNGLGKYPTLLVKLGETAGFVEKDNLDLWGAALPLTP